MCAVESHVSVEERDPFADDAEDGVRCVFGQSAPVDFRAISKRRFHLPKIGDAGDLVDAEPFKRSDWGPERASGLKMIGQWGPYVYWSSASLYVYQKRGPLAHFVAAKDIRGQVDLDFPAEKGRPMILGTTQGPQCYDWITEPEWMEMALDCYLLNGWEGAKSYFFPDGYDARYWRAYARAATRAAKYEDYTLGGVRDDASVSLEPVAEYAVPCHYVTLYIPKHRNVPLLQRAVWERDGRRIVGVFNFWEKGEAFFDLRLGGLASGRYAVVSEDGVLWAPDRKRVYWTAEELSGGIRLAVGAARTKVFEIRPQDGAKAPDDARSVMTRAALERLLKSRERELREAASEDRKIEDAAPMPTEAWSPLI